MKKPFLSSVLPFATTALLITLSVIASCKKESEAEIRDTGTTTVTNEVKLSNNIFWGDSSTATGKFDGVYNKDTKILTYTIVYSALTPTLMHFHKGAADTTGPAEVLIPGPYTSPLNKATAALTPAQETDLLAGKWYINIHTATQPDGEIRAQVLGNKVNFSNGVFEGDSTAAMGTFNGYYEKSTKVLNYTIVYSGFDAHSMYFYKRSKSQPDTMQLPISTTSVASPVNKSTVALSASQEADLLAGKWYAVIFTNTQPQREIKAQLIPGK